MHLNQRSELSLPCEVAAATQCPTSFQHIEPNEKHGSCLSEYRGNPPTVLRLGPMQILMHLIQQFVQFHYSFLSLATYPNTQVYYYMNLSKGVRIPKLLDRKISLCIFPGLTKKSVQKIASCRCLTTHPPNFIAAYSPRKAAPNS